MSPYAHFLLRQSAVELAALPSLGVVGAYVRVVAIPYCRTQFFMMYCNTLFSELALVNTCGASCKKQPSSNPAFALLVRLFGGA